VILKANLVGNAAPQLGGADLCPFTSNIAKPAAADITTVTVLGPVDEAFAPDPAKIQNKAAKIATVTFMFIIEIVPRKIAPMPGAAVVSASKIITVGFVQVVAARQRSRVRL
jgi:hypothetical protein